MAWYQIDRSFHHRAEEWDIGIADTSLNRIQTVSKKHSHMFFFFVLCFIIMICVFFLRILYIQIVHFETLSTWAHNNYLRTLQVPSARGLFFDRTGKQLVENISENTVMVIPADLPKNIEEKSKMLKKLSTLLEIPIEEIESEISKQAYVFAPIIIAVGVTHDQIVAIEESFRNSTAISISQSTSRKYTSPEIYSHVLGYTGSMTEKNEQEYLQKGYVRGEAIGISGLEKWYENNLHGKPASRSVEINAQGNIVQEKSQENAIPGKPLSLTLIDELQTFAAQRVKKTLETLQIPGASVIVGNPKTGEIYSYISLPGFDTNIFSGGIRGEEIPIYQSYLTSESKPLLDRTLSGLYAPGSVFKIITASAVLESGTVLPDELINAPGFITIQDQFDPTKSYIYKDWKLSGHGAINIVQAIAASSDTYFYQVVGGFEQRKGIGIKALADWTQKYGVHQTLGIDLPGEKQAVIPDPEWKQKTLQTSWLLGDTYNNSIGQGYLLMTPFHVYAMTSIMAYDGTLVVPHFAHNAPKKQKKIPISPQTVQTVQQGLEAVIWDENGTAKALRSLPFRMAGKTGTAQYNNNKAEHAWFVSYGPVEDPNVAIMVLVEGGGQGSATSVPIAYDILQYFFANKDRWGLNAY